MVKDAQGSPLDVGRKHRVMPTKIKRAVLARDRHCRFPGCAHTHFLEPHHVIHWADGGETKVDELISLCSRHHRLHHEGGYTVNKLNDGQFVFRNADGRLIPDAPPYRGTDNEDIDDATFAALIEQIAARHVPRGVCEEDSCNSASIVQDDSYTPRGGFIDNVTVNNRVEERAPPDAWCSIKEARRHHPIQKLTEAAT